MGRGDTQNLLQQGHQGKDQGSRGLDLPSPIFVLLQAWIKVFFIVIMIFFKQLFIHLAVKFKEYNVLNKYNKLNS